MIFIDTHIAVWLLQAKTQKISKSTLTILNERDIYLPHFAMLELEYLYAIKRTKLDANTSFNLLSESIGLKVSIIEAEQLIKESITLKETRDVFDRMIVSEAQFFKAELVTTDKKIRMYYEKTII